MAKIVTRLLMLLVALAAVGAVYVASTKEQIAKNTTVAAVAAVVAASTRPTFPCP